MSDPSFIITVAVYVRVPRVRAAVLGLLLLLVPVAGGAGDLPPHRLEVLPHEVRIGWPGTELILVTLSDAQGRGVAGAPVHFRVHDGQAVFASPVAYTHDDGRAYNVLMAYEDPGLIDTGFTVSAEGALPAGPFPVRGARWYRDGVLGFQAQPLPPFRGSGQLLVGTACGLVFEGGSERQVPAWSIDPRVAQIHFGVVQHSDASCETMEFPITARRPGRAMFIIGTADYAVYETEVAFVSFRRGDSNDDGETDISDALHTLWFLFWGSERLACEDAADSNDDGEIDVSDSIHSLVHLFSGGPRPPAPGPLACGFDPTRDALECVDSSPCPGQ